jgi:predicted dehydrogenase
VAVIGYRGRGTKSINGRGGSHIHGFANPKAMPDTVVTVLCDVDSTGADDAVNHVEGLQQFRPKYVQDLRRIMDDKEIDVVTIATPNHWHALAAIWAIQAGKDVYVEKPVSHNVFEGRRIVDFARKHNRIVQTGTQSRSSEGTRQLMDFLHAGRIGRVTLARGLCYKPRPSIGAKTEIAPPSGVDYDLWCGPAPVKPITRKSFHYDWHWQWEYGNGDLGNQGVHEMDRARWGLNKNSLPTAVFSLGGRFGYEDAGETANTQICLFDYGDAKLIFEVRGLGTPKYQGAGVGVIYYGPEGYAVSDSYSHGTAFSKDGQIIKEFKSGESHFANFIKAVKSRKHTDLNADIEEGHLSSALCHLGNISYQTGQVQNGAVAAADLQLDKEGEETYVRMIDHLKANNLDPSQLKLHVGKRLKFDPSAERFTNDEAANRLLSRDYRKGFEVPIKV